ncbi:putative Histidine phosphatase superfamily (branch 1) [Trypanosoma vivax]|uniref:Uncharacterized protein n=1 Tax=Trypanosoma vivax (strain Y486) TaxID=1055687 RepID=G0U2U6_TRYVY|nr:hypothetical protein TRVL_01947 [Trypanosoma vivax]KAH8604355.1 putative Histidine phosphatase superfamily (branch 1) [Trypanosoma vivax]CCC50600.1 conserved hypothetical protein [Trypanosoma vivax Y486]
MLVYLLLVPILIVGVKVTPAFQPFLLKMAVYLNGLYFMIVTNDLPKKFRGSNYIGSQASEQKRTRRVIRMVFIRHGQSVWNSLFNSYNLGWPARAASAILDETRYLFTDPLGSVIIDSPLSAKGRQEANELAEFVRSAKDKISFDTTSSVVVCSNLRRAMETAVIGLGPRIFSSGERIVIDSSLQEASRNIDAQTLSTEPGMITPSKMGKLNTPQSLGSVFDARLNAGNKSRHANVYRRMDDFVTRLFGEASQKSYVPAAGAHLGNAALKEVIVVGHSGYFRCFLRRFLPSASNHVIKSKKLQNCGVVAFDLVRNESTCEVYIDESTITVLYKGF